MAGCLTILKQRDIKEQKSYVLSGHNVDACLLDSRRATRKISVQPHGPCRRGYSKWSRRRRRKLNRVHSKALEKDSSLIVSNRDCQNHPDSYTAVGLVASLTACAQRKDIDTGLKIHMYVSRNSLLKDNVYVGTALVNLYAKCGALQKAQEVFDELPARNEVSWTALLTGYAHFGYVEEVFYCFGQMQFEGICPNEITLSSILKACGISGNLDKGQEIHTHILRGHGIADHIMVGNALVDMYAKCGALQKAQEVFDELRIRDVISWNTLITGYTQHGYAKEALSCFDQMQQAGFSPNAVTFICILKACGSIGASDKGGAIHSLITKECLLETHSKVANSLVDMYAKCGAFDKAHDVLNEVHVHNSVMWTAIITGYVQHEHDEEAIHCFQRMQSEGFSPDAFTFTSILKACANMKALKKGQEVHAQVLQNLVLLEDDVVVNALVDMYAKCGALQEAQGVFDEFSGWGVSLWNALISAYARHGLIEETWNCFERMLDEGCSPDEVTFACVLRVCSNLEAQEKSQMIQAEVLRHGMHETSRAICVALLNMYATYGLIGKAHEVFDKLQVHDSLSWGTLMVGYAQLGEGQTVLNLFDKMIIEGIEPEPVLFTTVLNACSQIGLLSKGQLYFESVICAFSIIPTLEHHTCMVSLFGSAGHLDKALAVIEAMPFPVDLTVWHTLLAICQRLGIVKLARWAFEHAVQLDEEDAAAYVFASNTFVDIGRHSSVI